MASRVQEKQRVRSERLEREAAAAQAARARRLGARIAAGVAVAVLVLAGIFLLSRGGDTGGGGGGGGQPAGAGKYKFAVGKPGPGAQAPQFQLGATDGSTVDLSKLRGQRVLLYFQEGVGCQPCWDQLRDIEKQFGKFRAAGVDRVVTITGDPPDALRQKVIDEGLKTPVLSDSGLAVSRAYSANQYGMMGTSTDGHSFILVDERGTIAWRADYGGAPDYTMYLPVENLLADLRAGAKS